MPRKVNTKCFDDLAPRLRALSRKPKRVLIRQIREIGSVHPGALRFALCLSDRIEEASEQSEEHW